MPDCPFMEYTRGARPSRGARLRLRCSERLAVSGPEAPDGAGLPCTEDGVTRCPAPPVEAGALFCSEQVGTCQRACAADGDCPTGQACLPPVTGGQRLCVEATCRTERLGRGPVGRACEPRAVPEDGFDSRVPVIETGSPDCDGGTCLVYDLLGDPRSGCDPRITTWCADPAYAASKVYCTCRCDLPEGQSGRTCRCPHGFLCVPMRQGGDPAARGSYCCNAEDPDCVMDFCYLTPGDARCE